MIDPKHNNRGGSSLSCLVWKLFVLPIDITVGTVGLITCLIELGFWVALAVLAYSLSMIKLTNSGRHRKPPITSPPVSMSVSTTAEAIDLDQAILEDQNLQDVAKCEEKVLSLGPDVTQLFVGLPIGEHKGRRLHCNATLQSVYDFVDGSSGCLEVGSYRLAPFFPCLLYGQDELSSTLEELGLYPQTSLFWELNT